ncbi:hypothetical protein YC2023_014850 [Brassica napus]
MSATVTLNPGNVWVSTPYGKVKEAVTYKLSVGMWTYLSETSALEGVDIALEHIHNIREALSELWEAVDDKAVEIRYIIHAKKPLLK